MIKWISYAKYAYAIVIRLAQVQLVPQLLWSAGEQHVEHMIVALLGALRADATLLQQVVRDIATDHLTLGIVVHLNEFTKTRRVVVACSLGIAKGFQHGIG